MCISHSKQKTEIAINIGEMCSGMEQDASLICLRLANPPLCATWSCTYSHHRCAVLSVQTNFSRLSVYLHMLCRYVSSVTLVMKDLGKLSTLVKRQNPPTIPALPDSICFLNLSISIFCILLASRKQNFPAVTWSPWCGIRNIFLPHMLREISYWLIYYHTVSYRAF